MTAPSGRLDVENLRVAGEGGRMILDVASLNVAPGSAVAVRGPSGAGKSTLLYALAGLLRPDAGAIRWDGTDIAALGESRRAAFRRERIGFIFQEHLLFEELTARDNAAIAALYAPSGARGAIREAGSARLARLGLDGAAGRRCDSFSGGERQRIAVARALAGAPDIILADEPTASLDRANADRLAGDLITLAREEGRTLIAVSHDTALHAAADRVIGIADGTLMPDGAAGAPVNA